MTKEVLAYAAACVAAGLFLSKAKMATKAAIAVTTAAALATGWKIVKDENRERPRCNDKPLEW